MALKAPFLLIMIVSFTLKSFSMETYHVPPIFSQCQRFKEGVSCMTLSQYANKSHDFFNSWTNTTLILLPGNHSLDSELVISNITHLTIFTSHLDTIVTCSPSARFKFQNIGHVGIHGIKFVECMDNSVVSVKQFVLEKCNFDCQGHDGNGLKLKKIQNATFTTFSFSAGHHVEYGVPLSAVTAENSGLHITDGSFSGFTSQTMLITNTDTTIVNCRFVNTSGMYGGALNAIGSKVMIIDVHFINSTAYFGGAVNVQDSNVTIFSSTFIENAANGDGGAIKLTNSSATIYSSSFLSNTAKGNNGGALSVTENSTLEMLDSVFVNNSAEYNYGGGVGGQISTIVIKNCTFVDHRAVYGSVVAIKHSSISVSDSSTFVNNIAVIGGGVMFTIEGMVTTITNAKFINNTAGNNGGTITAIQGSILLTNSLFLNNTASFGGGMTIQECAVIIKNSTFVGNLAEAYGGALYVATNSFTSIMTSIFVSNVADNGGAFDVVESIVTIQNSTIMSNAANVDGGALSFINSIASLNNTVLINNTAVKQGGAVVARHSNFTSVDSISVNNTALIGGGLALESAAITIEGCTFFNNIASVGGGLWSVCKHSLMCSAMNLIDSEFSYNLALTGAAMNVEDHNLNFDNYLDIVHNYANTGAVYLLNSTASLSGNITVSNNYGSMVLVSCTTTFKGLITFSNNVNLNTDSVNRTHSGDNYIWEHTYEEGGAVTCFQSTLNFEDAVSLMYNKAENGGAILATESKLLMTGSVLVAYNTAEMSGGGIYAFQSELNFKGRVSLHENVANENGGGIDAISSNLKLLRGSLHLSNNDAKRGGGVCLELYAKLYVIKGQFEFLWNTSSDWLWLEFTNNSADYGGAVYVSDDTNSGTCTSTQTLDQNTHASNSECFIQAVFFYDRTSRTRLPPNFINTNFTNNTARQSGRTLFGGLLDRCTLSPFAEIMTSYLYSNISLLGTTYFVSVTNLDRIDFTKEVSSSPVRLCFCRDGQPDCSYQPPTVYVMKGRPFNVSLVVVDQVNNTVPHSTIRGSLSSGHGRLSEGQSRQPTNESCTELQYNAFSPHYNETLLLYAEGPCNDTGISKHSIEVEFRPCHCPIGFEPADKLTECDCQCDPYLSPYITKCFYSNQTLLREGDFWINFINGSNQNETGVFIYPHCPFDYCFSPSRAVYVVSSSYGVDAQCAFNRSGVLCGSCQEGLSLSLGSSRCMPCSNHWLALIVPFVIAGIALVLFLSAFNCTVAVGTINGLILYANIIIANKDIFLPFDKSNFLTIFIAWLNLDFGFETCFYDGMDGYVKVWLQLVFPTYIIVMVTMVIIISEHSEKFSRLVFRINRNPVAVLATLIFLSYAKLLRTIIAALSFTTLEYSDGSHETVWLYNANISYLEGKHIPLFIAAVFILLVGVTFTLLLFFWQWLLKLEHYTNWRILKWCNNTRLHSFMDVYHAPHNKKTRYWTGLLLLARILLYIVSSLDHVIGDARVNLLSTICVVGGLLLLKEIQRDKTYKEHVNNLFESCFIFNLLIFASATYQFRETNEDQTILAYTSTSIAFITFLALVICHISQFTCITRCRKTECEGSTSGGRILNILFKRNFRRQQQTRDSEDHYNSSNLYDITDNEVSHSACSFTVIDGAPVDSEDQLQTTEMVEEDGHKQTSLGHTKSNSASNRLSSVQHAAKMTSDYCTTSSCRGVYRNEQKRGEFLMTDHELHVLQPAFVVHAHSAHSSNDNNGYSDSEIEVETVPLLSTRGNQA